MDNKGVGRMTPAGGLFVKTNPAVARFQTAFTESSQTLEAFAERGGKIVGYFCTYTPVEIIHACGFLPVRIMGEPGAVEKAYSLAPDFICPFMKRALEKALSGRYRFLSGLVQGYTCDVACGMIDIWKENIGGNLYHQLPLPYNNTPEARVYFRAELLSFVRKAEAAGGRFSPEKLEACLDLYEDIRRSMLELFDLRHASRLPLSAADLHTVVQAGFVCEPAIYLDMLRGLHSSLTELPLPAGGGIPILVSGSLIESAACLEAIENMGARIVADDLCSGYRHFQPAGGRGNDPLDRLMDRYLNRFPCPSRSRATERCHHLKDLLERSGARGVLFLLQKFCTPHLADEPMLSEQMQASGIPSIRLEMDETWKMTAGLQTRLQGFLELLGA